MCRYHFFYVCYLAINSAFDESVSLSLSLSHMRRNFLSLAKKSPLLSIKVFLEEKDK